MKIDNSNQLTPEMVETLLKEYRLCASMTKLYKNMENDCNMNTKYTYQKVVDIVDKATELLRNTHSSGEKYYQVLYYTYLSPKNLSGTRDIIENINAQNKICKLARSTYFLLRKKALTELAIIISFFDHSLFD